MMNLSHREGPTAFQKTLNLQRNKCRYLTFDLKKKKRALSFATFLEADAAAALVKLEGTSK